MPEVQLALSVEAITVSFGGVIALDAVSLEVGDGEIVGLLGPNGAGKTTLLNAVSGHLRSPTGRIRILGQDVSSLPTERRAKLGLGRTYQDARLFPGLTVREAVQLGLTSAESVGFTAALVGAPWARFHERALGRRADEVIEQFGLEPWTDSLLAHLSTGTRRACDIAMRVAAGSRVLLLDEPTAGLAQGETAAIGALLRRVCEDVGCSILVVEHDIPFMMDITHRLYALEAGRVIADGPPAHIRSHPAVLASYLGTTGVRRRTTRARGR